MRWLWSAKAIECHILFWMLGATLVSLLLGRKAEMQKFLPGNDWIWLLLFLVAGYPLVLFLIWFEHRNAPRAFARDVVERLSEPEKVKARRAMWRRGSLVALTAASGAAIYFGNRGLLIEGLPAQYIGYFLLSFTALGACGVNIWYGGPTANQCFKMPRKRSSLRDR